MSNTHHKLQLFEPTSRLAYAETMSAELLSEFTDNDVQKYANEHTTIKKHQVDDVQKAQLVISDVLEGLNYLYGEDAKQVKYITRSFAKGETNVDTHYAKFSPPNVVGNKIDDAKAKCGVQTTKVGLSETNVDDLNDAITYLTERGFVFGRDFTAHNALDMAKAQYLENCQADKKWVEVKNSTPNCDECDTAYVSDNVDLQRFTISCRCYEDKGLDVTFENNAPVFKVIA
tara:strand:+ start:14 stop:703 length:690 start_codon:yes stop_codon:yes gene_type:complete